MAHIPEHQHQAAEYIMAAWAMYMKARCLDLAFSADDLDHDTLEVLFEMRIQLDHAKEQQTEAKNALRERSGRSPKRSR